MEAPRFEHFSAITSSETPLVGDSLSYDPTIAFGSSPEGMNAKFTPGKEYQIVEEHDGELMVRDDENVKVKVDFHHFRHKKKAA